MNKWQARIVETSCGWLWCEMGLYFPTARKAFNAVKRHNSDIAKTVSSAVAIDWHVKSDAGEKAVNLLSK